MVIVNCQLILEPFEKRGFVFAGEDVIGEAGGAEVIFVQTGVKAVETDFRGGVERADAARNFHAQAEGGVHGHGDADKIRARGGFGGEGFNRKVYGMRGETCLGKVRERGGEGEGLVAEFVTGEEEKGRQKLGHYQSYIRHFIM